MRGVSFLPFITVFLPTNPLCSPRENGTRLFFINDPSRNNTLQLYTGYWWNSRPFFFLNRLTCQYKIISNNRVYSSTLGVSYFTSLINYMQCNRLKYCDLFINESLWRRFSDITFEFHKNSSFRARTKEKNFRKSWYFTIRYVTINCVGCPDVLARASHAFTSVFRSRNWASKKRHRRKILFARKFHPMKSSYLISFLYKFLRLKENILKFAEYKTNVNM